MNTLLDTMCVCVSMWIYVRLVSIQCKNIIACKHIKTHLLFFFFFSYACYYYITLNWFACLSNFCFWWNKKNVWLNTVEYSNCKGKKPELRWKGTRTKQRKQQQQQCQLFIEMGWLFVVIAFVFKYTYSFELRK